MFSTVGKRRFSADETASGGGDEPGSEIGLRRKRLRMLPLRISTPQPDQVRAPAPEDRPIIVHADPPLLTPVESDAEGPPPGPGRGRARERRAAGSTVAAFHRKSHSFSNINHLTIATGLAAASLPVFATTATLMTYRDPPAAVGMSPTTPPGGDEDCDMLDCSTTTVSSSSGGGGGRSTISPHGPPMPPSTYRIPTPRYATFAQRSPYGSPSDENGALAGHEPACASAMAVDADADADGGGGGGGGDALARAMAATSSRFSSLMMLGNKQHMLPSPINEGDGGLSPAGSGTGLGVGLGLSMGLGMGMGRGRGWGRNWGGRSATLPLPSTPTAATATSPLRSRATDASTAAAASAQDVPPLPPRGPSSASLTADPDPDPDPATGTAHPAQWRRRSAEFGAVHGHPSAAKPQGKPMLVMGFRAECEKCRARVPGHYSHIIRA
ncbi:MAG: hypothetical protein M1826_001838 [Phylliscum demangeonii]|nr:MAG: hypothetical protein M1826_001838 [Phylliscum demangeonii]